MSEWKNYKIEDVATLSNGINFDKSAYTKGIKLIGVSDFKDRIYPDYDTLQEVKSDVVRTSDLLSKGDIIFVRSNGNKELVGRCMMVNMNIPVTYSGFCIRLHVNNQKLINPTFLTYLCKSKDFRKKMSGTAVGANIQNLSQGRLGSCEFSCPDLPTQTRIATILSRYDSLIENYQKQIKLLEEAAQRLYKEWFVDLRFPGHEKVKVVDGVPEGWERKSVDSVISLLSGYAFKSSSFNEVGKYKIVTIKNVKDGVFDGDNVSTIVSVPDKMPKHCVLKEGDILLSLTGNVGRVCMVSGTDYLLNQRVAKLKSSYPSFAYCLFRNHDMFVAVNNLANGAAQQNVSPIRIGQMKTLIPSESNLKEFETLASKYIKKVILLQKQIRLLIESRDRILVKLMSGEIEV